MGDLAPHNRNRLLDLAYERLALGSLSIEPPFIDDGEAEPFYQFDIAGSDGQNIYSGHWVCTACERIIDSPRGLWAVHVRPPLGGEWHRRWVCSETCGRQVREYAFEEMSATLQRDHPDLAATLAGRVERIKRGDLTAPELLPWTVSFEPANSEACRSLEEVQTALRDFQFGFPQPASPTQVSVPMLALEVVLSLIEGWAGWRADPASLRQQDAEHAKLPGYPLFPNGEGYDLRHSLLQLELFKVGVYASLTRRTDNAEEWDGLTPYDTSVEALSRAYAAAAHHLGVVEERDAVHEALRRRLEEIGRQLQTHTVPRRARQLFIPLETQEETP